LIFSDSNFWLKYPWENECPKGKPIRPYIFSFLESMNAPDVVLQLIAQIYE